MKKIKTIYMPGYVQIDGVHENIVTGPKGYENYYEAEQELLDLHLKPTKNKIEVNLLDLNGNSQWLNTYVSEFSLKQDRYYFIAKLYYVQA